MAQYVTNCPLLTGKDDFRRLLILEGNREPLLQTADPVPQGLQIFIVERQFPNVLIKMDRMPQVLFRLFHAARDARITGEIEGD